MAGGGAPGALLGVGDGGGAAGRVGGVVAVGATVELAVASAGAGVAGEGAVGRGTDAAVSVGPREGVAVGWAESEHPARRPRASSAPSIVVGRLVFMFLPSICVAIVVPEDSGVK